MGILLVLMIANLTLGAINVARNRHTIGIFNILIGIVDGVTYLYVSTS